MIQKQKGNSGYLNKRQLKKINPGSTLLEEKVTRTKIHTMLLLGLEQK